MPQMGAKREYQGYEYTFNGQNWVRGAATAAPETADPIARKFNAATRGAEATAGMTEAELPYAAKKAEADARKAAADADIAEGKAKAAQRKQTKDMTEVMQQMKTVVANTIRLKQLSRDRFGATGFGHQTIKDFGPGGTSAANVEALLTNVGANSAFDKLQKIKSESENGGGLGGNTSDADMALLKSSVAALDPNQSDEQFQQQMDQVIKAYGSMYAKLGGKLTELGPVEELAPAFPNLAREQRNAPGAVTPTDVPPSEAQPDDLSWGDVPMEALSNLPKSAMGLAEGLVQPVLHPIDTLTSLGSIVGGVLNKLDPTGAIKFDEGSADAVGGWFASRYGSMDGFKRAIAEDPAGVLADAATVLTAGGAGAARVGGKIGQIGAKAAKVGNAIDPFVLASKAPAAARAVGSMGESAAAHIMGLPSGVGAPALETSRDAGRAGGEQLKALRANRRGNVPIDDVLTEAKDAVSRMREEASTRYKQGMGEVSKDVNVLPFTDIEDAVQKARAPGFFKGEVKDKSAAAAWGKVDELIQHWKSLDPAEYHTPEGMDALKQAIGDIANEIPMENRSASRAVTQAYNAVKREIVKQAPTYAKVMKDYERASTQVREVEKTLSLGNNASPDTALRKLQSILRNNANTNYGRRRDLGNMLEDYGADTLMPSLAGQQTSSWTPRGLAGITSSLGSTAAMAGLLGPKAAAALGVASPRVMGALAEKYGQATGPITKLFAERTPSQKGITGLAGKYMRENPQAALFGSDIGRLSQIYGDQQQEEQPKPREAPAGVSVRLPVLEAVFGPGADFGEDGSVHMQDGTVVPPDVARQAIRAATAGAQ